MVLQILHLVNLSEAKSNNLFTATLLGSDQVNKFSFLNGLSLLAKYLVIEPLDIMKYCTYLNKPLYIKQSDYEKNSSNYVKLPLIVIKKEFLESNSKIVQVGDLVDRGENSTECLVLSSLLSKQLRQNYTTIIGNHELAKLQGLYYDKNDTQKQLIADMIKSGNMLCMQHIPGSNNIYSHVPLFKKNISSK